MRVSGCAVVAALLFGCSSSGGGGVTGAGGSGASGGACPTAYSTNGCVDGCNPCTRISDAQVAAAVGQPAVTGQWDGDACLWDFYSGANLLFEVNFGINTDYGTFRDICHGGSVDGGFDTTPVSGVGDDACYFNAGGTLGAFEIDFLKGCFAYSISITSQVGQPPPFPTATLQADEKTMALEAVPNL